MKIWDSQGVYDLLSTITTMYYIMCSLLQPRGNIWSIQNKTCDRQQNNKVRSFSYQILSTPRREQMSWHTFIPLGRKNILCKNMIRCGSNQIVLTHRPNIHHILIEPRAYNLTKALVDRLHPSTTWLDNLNGNYISDFCFESVSKKKKKKRPDEARVNSTLHTLNIRMLHFWGRGYAGDVHVTIRLSPSDAIELWHIAVIPLMCYTRQDKTRSALIDCLQTGNKTCPKLVQRRRNRAGCKLNKTDSWFIEQSTIQSRTSSVSSWVHGALLFLSWTSGWSASSHFTLSASFIGAVCMVGTMVMLFSALVPCRWQSPWDGYGTQMWSGAFLLRVFSASIKVRCLQANHDSCPYLIMVSFKRASWKEIEENG